MAAQNFQQSPSSQSSARQNEMEMEIKGNDDVVQHENQPISNAPPLQQIQRNEEEPKARKTYSCRHCDKTFSTSMALGGHQNGHKRLRALAKRQAEAPVSDQPYPANYASYPNYRALALNNNISQGMRTDSMTYKKPSNLSMESSTSSTDTWRLLAEFYAKMGTKPHPATESAPPPVNSVPPAATSTMLFGVPDFFGVSSAPKTTASIGASGNANIINLEDEEEDKDASGLDLDLKL